MRKVFFAAIAAMVIVSVSSVFSNSAKSEMSIVMPADTTANDTVAPAQEPTDTAVKVNPGADDTAWLMLTDSTEFDSSSVEPSSLV